MIYNKKTYINSIEAQIFQGHMKYLNYIYEGGLHGKEFVLHSKWKGKPTEEGL